MSIKSLFVSFCVDCRFIHANCSMSKVSGGTNPREEGTEIVELATSAKVSTRTIMRLEAGDLSVMK